ncbi:MAG: hypothetical protein IRZ05_13875 [Micromonosporaceae bacterium]|nr:hypothetical protein [Micromonosporaceae bacterium]
MFSRRPAKTRSELFRDELGESFGHLKQAASHGADTVSTAMRPRMSAAKRMAMGTAAGAMARMAAARKQQAGEKARSMVPMMGRNKMPMMGRNKRKREMARKRRGRRLAGLLAAGAAAGAVGTLIGRRRRHTSWDAYDTSARPPREPTKMAQSHEDKQASQESTTAAPLTSQTRQPMPGKGTQGVGPLADQARRALSGAEPEVPEAEAISPTTHPSSNRGR